MAKRYGGVDNLEVLLSEAKNYNNFLKEAVFDAGKKFKTALDFGAGLGDFAKALRELGVKVECVETDELLAARLKNLGFDVHADIKDVPAGSIDYIYSLNVLEHIEDDRALLRLFYECLAPDGILFLYVPAFNILYSSMDEKVKHLRRYRKRGLCRLIKDAGFKVEKARYADSLGFFISIAFRFFGNRKGDLNPRYVKIYDSVFFPVSRVLDRVCGYFFGKNLLVIACRRGTPTHTTHALHGCPGWVPELGSGG